MKKNLKFLTSAIALLALTACGESGNDSNLTFYKTAYSNGSYFETVKESKESNTDVYITLVDIFNRTGASVTIEAKDFSLKANNKDYTCLYFVKATKYESIKVNGENQSIYYVSESSQTRSIENSESSLDQVRCAFEIDAGTNPSIFYKGTALSSLTK